MMDVFVCERIAFFTCLSKNIHRLVNNIIHYFVNMKYNTYIQSYDSGSFLSSVFGTLIQI